MIQIEDFLDASRVLINLPADDKSSVLRRMTDVCAKQGGIEDSEVVHQLLMEREDLMTTGVKEGIAFPHVFNKQAPRTLMMLGLVPEGVAFDSLDDQPVHIIFLLLGPPNQQATHLRLLARLSRLTATEDFAQNLRRAESPEAALDVIRQAEQHITDAH